MDEITGLPVVELMPVGARDLGPRSETELSEVEAVPSAS
jgi:hypothetical protein